MGIGKWATQQVHGRDEVLLDIEKRACGYSERVVQDVKDMMNDYEVDLYRLILAVGKRYGMDTAYELMSETVTDKRLKWLDQAREWLVLEGTDLERGLKLFASYFKPKAGELKIIEQTERNVVFRRKEFVNAITYTCEVLGLDIVEVNNKIYARATNLMFDSLNLKVKYVVLNYQDGWYDEMIENDPKPAGANLQAHMQDEKYPPHVHPDGRVTFRVKAPMAQKVQIEPINGQPENNGYNGLGKAPYDMTKDQEGLWSVTTTPVVPGLHGYWLVVDGVRVNDTSSKTYGSSKMQTCGVEVPEPGVNFYDIKDAPHGQVRMQWYYSMITNAWRRAFIYTPPGYDTHPEQRYPVFILRHGGGEDETGWVEQGRANFILDNLIAAGKAKPMIVVMDWGQSPRPDQPIHIPSTPPPPEIGQVTINELIPMVDATFRTIPDREHRAMAGLSMGSVQTLYIGLTNLDTFSALGIFSRRPMDENEFNVQKSFDGVFVDAAAFNKKMHLFWWGAGTVEEGIYNATKANLAALDKVGIKSVFVEFPGTSHEWQTWRKSLYDFAPRLFRWS